MSGAESTTIRARDGRQICVELAGDGGGRAVLVHNGSPNSRHLYDQWVSDATAKGIRLISYDRPGYGASTAHPDHRVSSGADDVRDIAAALGIERLGVWGVSGGGPYAAACAALLPDLVVAAGIVASLAPYGSPGLDYLDGMGESNAEDIQLFFSDREAARKKSYEDWKLFTSATPEQLAEGLASLISPVDAQALEANPGLGEWLSNSMKDGLAPGDEGWWDDSPAALTDWGFDLKGIRVPVKVWHGRNDRFVPFQHGEWLAANIPGAEAHFTDDGHLSQMSRVGEIHDWLLAHF